MKIEKYQFDQLRGVSRLVMDGIASDLAFCHPAINGIVKIDSVKGQIELEVSSDLSDDEYADLLMQVTNVIDMSIKSFRFVEETPPLWSHDSKSLYDGKRSLRLFSERYMIELGPGQYAYHGLAKKLFDFFSNRILNIAETIGAESWILPNIEMTYDLIRETGYFTSHPQLVTFGYRLPPHYEMIRNFASAAKEKKLAGIEDSHMLEPTGFILEPFVCHNIYRSLKNQYLDNGRIITAQGKCYRYEGFLFSPLLRQWEFSMREIVLVGEHDFLMAVRQSCIELTQSMVKELDLNATLEIATDPFFVSEAATLRTFQIMQSTKLELRLHIDEKESTATASFNIHGKHFTQPMEIQNQSGKVLETACAAYGIERWMAAFIARWSEDSSKWPISI